MNEKFKVELKTYITITVEGNEGPELFDQAFDEVKQLLSPNESIQIEKGGGMFHRVKQ